MQLETHQDLEFFVYVKPNFCLLSLILSQPLPHAPVDSRDLNKLKSPNLWILYLFLLQLFSGVRREYAYYTIIVGVDRNMNMLFSLVLVALVLTSSVSAF